MAGAAGVSLVFQKEGSEAQTERERRRAGEREAAVGSVSQRDRKVWPGRRSLHLEVPTGHWSEGIGI